MRRSKKLRSRPSSVSDSAWSMACIQSWSRAVEIEDLKLALPNRSLAIVYGGDFPIFDVSAHGRIRWRCL